MEPTPGIRIAPSALSPEALRGVVEEFVTRDGTNLAEGEVKVAQVMRLMARGEVELWFDQTSRTCNIIVKPQP
ncbi:MAG: YheU family protein [Planctomycetota bacterium]|nr:YheU family protein [Planctomycetota bacterium]